MKNYYNLLSGGMPIMHFLAALTFASIGWFVYKTITGLRRERGSQRTPAKWSWKFWIADNYKEAFQHFVIMFVLVRFASEILAQSGIKEQIIESNDPMWIYFVVGVVKSWLLDMWKKRKKSK